MKGLRIGVVVAALCVLSPAAPAGTAPAHISAPSPLSGLPLVEVPAKHERGDAFVLLLTGDGGWADLARDIAKALSGRGIPVVGLDSLGYFWNARTPKEATADLERIMKHYLAAWHKQRVILVGYSFGADVLPFVVRRMSAANRGHVARVVLLAPSTSAEFDFHVAGWLGYRSDEALPVRPEIDAVQGVPLVCVSGIDDGESLCPMLIDSRITHVQTPGGHHFGGKVGPVVDAILGEKGEQ